MSETQRPRRGRRTERWTPARERPATRPTRARLLTVRVLERVERGGAFADLALSAALARSGLTPEDRALATELLYGTLRWRGRLDFLLSHVLDRDLEKVESVVKSILRIGAYQIAMLDRIPAAHAVDQMVRCARAAGASRASGFINGVLRQLTRELEQIRFPDFETDPLGYIVHHLSLPEWIAVRWIDRHGAEETAALARAANERPPVTIRANPRRQSRDELADSLRERFPEIAACDVASHGLVLGGSLVPGKEPGFRDGCFTVQDEASQAVIDLLDPQVGDRVLDTCAAPGTKATGIAERIGDEGEVMAVDRHERRLALVGRDARRLGLDNLRARCLDATTKLAEVSDTPFDRTLVDAPCSGLGTLRRNPDARWRVRSDDPERLAETQKKLLEAAAEQTRAGGVLVYSTCTIEPEENEAVVDVMLNAESSRLRLADPGRFPEALRPWLDERGFLRSYPHRSGADGFFAARFDVLE